MSKSGYAPGSMVELTPDELRDWRRNLPKGSRRTVDIGTRNLTPISAIGEDTVTMGRDYTPRAYVEPLEVMAKVVGPMLQDLLRTKAVSESAFLDRVRNLKAVAGWDHLSDEEAATQLEGLATKIAATIADKQYRAAGKVRPVDMNLEGIGHQSGPILLPGQVGRGNGS